MTDIRIGYGFDVHQLKEGLEMWIGGVKVEHTKGWVAHSDGDVLIHAICDALLGAAGMRDIGYHFPDTDDSFKGIDSKQLLRRTIELIAQKGYKVGNIDSTIALQRPKIKPLIEQMQQTLANVIGISADRISVKATTTEHLGYEGEEKGASAYAVALIYKE